MEWYKTSETDFGVEIGFREEEQNRAFRVLIFGTPGTPIFELGNYLSDYYQMDLFDLERSYSDSYFLDKIESIKVDIGDRTIGSGSSHESRDPETESRYRAISRFLEIPDVQTVALSMEDKMKILAIKNGIIVSEMSEPILIQWVRRVEGLVIYLDLDEEKAVDWLKDRRK